MLGAVSITTVAIPYDPAAPHKSQAAAAAGYISYSLLYGETQAKWSARPSGRNFRGHWDMEEFSTLARALTIAVDN